MKNKTQKKDSTTPTTTPPNTPTTTLQVTSTVTSLPITSSTSTNSPTLKARGRPKGVKNRSKDVIEQEKKEKEAKPKKKRGRKNPFRSHNFVSLSVDLEHASLSVEDVSDQFLSDRMFFLLSTLLFLFAGNYLTSNYVENIFSQLKLNLRRGLKADPLKFLQTMFLFTIENHDRINETAVLQELIDSYVTEFSPPIGFGYRQHLKGPVLPYMFSSAF